MKVNPSQDPWSSRRHVDILPSINIRFRSGNSYCFHLPLTVRDSKTKVSNDCSLANGKRQVRKLVRQMRNDRLQIKTALECDLFSHKVKGI